MNNRSANIVSGAVIAAFIAYVAYLYPGLPDPIPTHWDGSGQPNDYMSKQGGVLAFIAVPLLSILVFKLIPLLSPRGFRTEQFATVINMLMVGMVVFGCVIGVVALQAARDANVDINKIVFVSVGALLMFVGNFMGKFRKNFFIGIRTPWTLASDEVWAKTHRLGGWCIVIAGLVMVAAAMLDRDPTWAVFVVIGMVLIPVVYSYFAYRSIVGFAPDPDIDDDDVDSAA